VQVRSPLFSGGQRPGFSLALSRDRLQAARQTPARDEQAPARDCCSFGKGAFLAHWVARALAGGSAGGARRCGEDIGGTSAVRRRRASPGRPTPGGRACPRRLPRVGASWKNARPTANIPRWGGRSRAGAPAREPAPFPPARSPDPRAAGACHPHGHGVGQEALAVRATPTSRARPAPSVTPATLDKTPNSGRQRRERSGSRAAQSVEQAPHGRRPKLHHPLQIPSPARTSELRGPVQSMCIGPSRTSSTSAPK
jgi:hypothetical protein